MEADVCVIGGGPAGSVAAFKLARLGYLVVLVEAMNFPRHHVGEALSPNIVPFLQDLELYDQIVSQGFLRSSSSRIRWEGREEVRVENPGHAGFQVERGQFDRILVEEARAAGVRVLQPARVKRIEGDGPVRIAVDDEPGPLVLSARMVIDASGRRGVIRATRKVRAPKLLALYSWWRSVDLPKETLVEAMPWGWIWGTRLSLEIFSTVVFLDPALLIERRDISKDQLNSLLLESSELFRFVRRCEGHGQTKACDASITLVDPIIQASWIKVGEAAFTLDPLSSQGVAAAMRSALQGALVVHTMLSKPERSEICRKFYTSRQESVIENNVIVSSNFYRKATQFRGESFWEKRSHLDDLAGQSQTGKQDDSQINHWFSDNSRVALAPGTRLLEEPVLDGNLVTSKDVVDNTSLKEPVGFVGGHEAAQLFKIAGLLREGKVATVGQIRHQWCALMPDSQVQAILKWFTKNGIITISSM